MPERLEMCGATKVFGSDAGIVGVDLTVGVGEVHALIGLNGAGKTTLMGAILGMLRLTSGDITLDGVRLADLPATDWSRVGHLVGRPFGYPDLDIRTNLVLAARLNGVEPPQVADVVDAAVTDMDLRRYANVPARQLSQGNVQRLGLAAALQHHPGLIVLDEPTNALDPAGVILLREHLVSRVSKGSGVLVSSHHLDEVARIAHRISVLNRGRIVGALSPDTPDLERAFFELVRDDDQRRPR